MQRVFIFIIALIFTTLSTISFADSLNKQDSKNCICNPTLYAKRKVILEKMITYMETRNMNGLLSQMSDKNLTFAELMGTGRVVHSKAGVRKILGGFWTHLTKETKWDVKRMIIDNCQNAATIQILDHIQYDHINIVTPAVVVIQFDKNNKIESRQDFSDSAVFLNAMHGKSWISKK